MFKFFILCVLCTSVCCESIDWFEGRWLPTVLYSNTFTNKTEEWIGWHGQGYIGLWTGSMLEPKECGWLDVHNTRQNCTCDNRRTPLVRMQDFGNLNQHQFYQFHLNESRPVLVVDTVEEVEAALSANCTCGSQIATQLVFRKTSKNYLMAYENKGKTKTSPNMTLVMFRFVPTMSDLQKITNHYPEDHLDVPFQQATLMCDPTFFDDSAYVVSSGEDDSPFITLGDLKGSNLVKESTENDLTAEESSTIFPKGLKSRSFVKKTSYFGNDIEFSTGNIKSSDTLSMRVVNGELIYARISSSERVQPLVLGLFQLITFLFILY